MELRPIRTRREYQAALGAAEQLWHAPEKSPKAERLQVLALLIEDYERKHFPIQDPDPIDFLHQVMEWPAVLRVRISSHSLAQERALLRC